MLQPLRAEGLTDLEIFGVVTNASSWEAAAPGFDQASFPLLLDVPGAIFYLYSTKSDDMIYIDRKMRLVTKQEFDPRLPIDSVVPSIKQRLRELHAE